MTPNFLPDVWLTAARAPHQPAARLVDNKNISALLKISTATRKQFCKDYQAVVSNIGPLTVKAERQLSPVRAAPAAACTLTKKKIENLSWHF